MIIKTLVKINRIKQRCHLFSGCINYIKVKCTFYYLNVTYSVKKYWKYAYLSSHFFLVTLLASLSACPVWLNDQNETTTARFAFMLPNNFPTDLKFVYVVGLMVLILLHEWNQHPLVRGDLANLYQCILVQMWSIRDHTVIH